MECNEGHGGWSDSTPSQRASGSPVPLAERRGMATSFWDLYASVYDSIRHLDPYRGMLADVLATARVQEGERVLDAGCGTGNLLCAVGPGARRSGVDASEAMLRRAARRCPEARLERADLAGSLPFPDGSFDVVLSSNVLYAVPEPEDTLRELFRVVRPGGRLVLATPRAAPTITGLIRAQLAGGPAAWLTFLALLPALMLVWAFNLPLLSGRGPRPSYFPPREELAAALTRAGFATTRIDETYAGQDWLVLAERPSLDRSRQGPG